MRIWLNNSERVNVALKAVEGRARVRRLLHSDLIAAAEKADEVMSDLRIPIARRVYSQIIIEPETVPLSYSGLPYGTAATLQVNSTGEWYLTALSRKGCKRASGGYPAQQNLYISEQAREWIPTRWGI